jgi:hypothetical protein
MSEIGLISFGFVGGRPVFMDERHDSYFLLEEKEEAEFLELIESDATIKSAGPGLRSALDAQDGSPRIILAQPPRATRSLLDEIDPAAKPRIRDVVSVAWLLRRSRHAIATRPIGEILFDLGKDSEPDRGQCEGLDPVANAARFITARRLVPYAPNCLTDSLALVRWLGRSGASLVFGVKLEPFSAHCWVQLDDLLLNDRADTAAQFQPVRVAACATL